MSPLITIEVADETELQKLLLWAFQNHIAVRAGTTQVAEPMPVSIKSPQSLKATVEDVKARALELNKQNLSSIAISAQLRKEFPEWRGAPGLTRNIRSWITETVQTRCLDPKHGKIAVCPNCGFKVDGRTLRWKRASPQAKAKWVKAIKQGRQKKVKK